MRTLERRVGVACQSHQPLPGALGLDGRDKNTGQRWLCFFRAETKFSWHCPQALWFLNQLSRLINRFFFFKNAKLQIPEGERSGLSVSSSLEGRECWGTRHWLRRPGPGFCSDSTLKSQSDLEEAPSPLRASVPLCDQGMNVESPSSELRGPVCLSFFIRPFSFLPQPRSSKSLPCSCR